MIQKRELSRVSRSEDHDVWLDESRLPRSRVPEVHVAIFVDLLRPIANVNLPALCVLDGHVQDARTNTIGPGLRPMSGTYVRQCSVGLAQKYWYR